MSSQPEGAPIGRAARAAGLLGLAGSALSALLVAGALALVATFYGVIQLAVVLAAKGALHDDLFDVGALLAVAVGGALVVGAALSHRRTIIAALAWVVALLAYLVALSTTSAGFLMTSALVAAVTSIVAFVVLGAAVARRLASVGHRLVTTSSFAAGVSAATGVLSPIVAVPIFVMAAVPALASAVAIAATVDFPEPGTTSSRSVAVLKWFADIGSLPATEDDELADKWSFSDRPAEGAGGEGAPGTTWCFEVLTKKRPFGGRETVPYADAVQWLTRRGLSDDDATDAASSALVDVCTSADAPDEPDRLRAYYARSAQNRGRDLFRVPVHVPVDAETLKCPNPPVVDLIESREFSRIVADARAVLSDDENKILTLWTTERSLMAVAIELRISKSEAKRRFDRALGKLVRILQARGCPVRGGSPQATVSP